MLYAADISHGGLQSRLFVNLDVPEPPLELWWLSVHGIYRPCPPPSMDLPETISAIDLETVVSNANRELLHHKYQIPSRCFAYVGVANQPGTWKLPYLRANGSPDLKRLPKAIGAILSNYRGVKVSIPREAVADVLVRLGKAAASVGKMPCQTESTAEVYAEAHEALDQLGRLDDVGCCR